MTCTTCEFSTNKEILLDPNKIDEVEDVEKHLPRCMSAKSPRHGLIVYPYTTCDRYRLDDSPVDGSEEDQEPWK